MFAMKNYDRNPSFSGNKRIWGKALSGDEFLRNFFDGEKFRQLLKIYVTFP